MNNKVIAAVLIVAGTAGGVWWSKRAPAGDAAAAAAPTAASGASGAGAAASGASGGRNGPQTVGVFTAQQRDVPITVEATGSVVALKSAEVRPQVAGTIAEVAVREGQTVRKGDVLFRMDDRTDQANLARAQAQLQKDKATQMDLERQLRRARELVEQNFMSRGAVDTLQAQVEAQIAAVNASVAAIRAAEVTLTNDVLRAPISGRAGAMTVVQGMLVQPGGASLVSLSQMDPIGVTFSLPEAQLAPLRRAEREQAGDKATERAAGSGVELTVQLPGERRNQPGASLPGVVSFIDNAVDTTTGTIRIKGTVANAERQLWPGQFTTIKMTLRTLKDAIVIPQAAMIMRGSERSVYVVGDDGKAQMKTVQMRQALGELAVVEGITLGEKVVVEGKQNLRPGTAVREVSSAAGKGGGAAGGGSGSGAGGAGAAASAPAPAVSGASR